MNHFPFLTPRLVAVVCASIPVVACAQTPPNAPASLVGAPAKPFLHPMFSDGAVLQRDRRVPVWGWTRPGAPVRLRLDGATSDVLARADAQGYWTASLAPQRAGTKRTLQIIGEGAAERLTRRDLAFGDVWICSGQSNMEWRLFYGEPPVNNALEEQKAADFPDVRFVTVPHVTALEPQPLADVSWRAISPQTVGEVSAVGYFFGRDLHQRLGVPIGLIDASWGGSAAQSWASLGALDALPELKSAVAGARQARASGAAVPYALQLKTWLEAGDSGRRAGYAAPDFDDSAWNKANLPGEWESSGAEFRDFDGIVWYRREIEVPPTAANRDLTLELGAIDDADTTFWNGEPIGETVGEPNGHTKPRIYRIPAAQVRAGRNVIAVRVLDTGGGGGFSAAPGTLKLTAPGVTIPLEGAWRVRIAATLKDLPALPVDPGQGLFNVPGAMFNGMIAPLVPYGVKGAVWYQGESNAWNAQGYKTLLPTLIGDWRKRFGSDIPFYIVQLSAFGGRVENAESGQGSWAEIRESQAQIAAKVKNSGLAVTIDIGDERDIHPRNKQDVGKRLALLALAKTYGQAVEFQAPKYERAIALGNALRLEFGSDQQLDAATLRFTGDTKRLFIVAGQDKIWRWGTVTNLGTRIENGRLVPFLDVSSPEVPKPVAARYAWSNTPHGAILTRSGLPFAPFRTDDWK